MFDELGKPSGLVNTHHEAGRMFIYEFCPNDKYFVFLFSSYCIIDCFASNKPLNFDIHNIFGTTTKLTARKCRDDAIQIIKNNISVLSFFCWKHAALYFEHTLKTDRAFFHGAFRVYRDTSAV